MDNLPDEIQLNIYERLDFLDRNKLRLTCKSIRNLVNQIRIDDLFFCGAINSINSLLNSNTWFYSNDLIDLRTIIHNYDHRTDPSFCSKNLLILKKKSIQLTLRRLKIAYTLDLEDFNLNILEQFSILEQLEFSLIHKSNRLYQNLIKLNELRNLLIYSCETTINNVNQQNLINISIDSPKLVNCYFGYNVINCIELVHAFS